MGDSITQYMERPKHYANIDGTSEMGVGVCLLGLALMGYVEAALPPKDSIWQHGFPSRLFLAFIVITFCCLGYFGPKAIKKYITYPRTGYAVLRGPKGLSRTRVALLSSVGGAAIAAGMGLAARHIAIAPPRLGILGMSVLVWCLMGLFFARTSRWKWFVYGLLALGLAASFLATGGKSEDAAHRGMLLASLTYIASGAATFFLYMRRTKPGRIE
jgi:hypothetical protein